jgi:PAS domain S-box-containing protein
MAKIPRTCEIMETPQKIIAARIPARSSSRPTIGLMIGRLGDQRYQANVWPGVADVARERDANLICFVGGALRGPSEFDTQRNIAYDFASPVNVDGLVTMSGSLAQFIGPEILGQFFKRYRPLPIVSIALAIKNVPSVLVDNMVGMRDLIAHLIEVHRFRRIAFIRGPEANPEAEHRYHAYRAILSEHGIPLDPELVAPGNFLSPSGEEAVHLLLDQRKVGFEAVVSANDEMALGVITALMERGRHIPEDVSVVGFDDIEEARFASPPLTTVHQPLYEQGRRATEMLLDMLAGKEVPERITLPTELTIRRSCGCFSPALAGTTNIKHNKAAPEIASTALERREEIISSIQAAADPFSGDLAPDWAARLLDNFIASLSEPSKGTFLSMLDGLLRQLGAKGADILQWRDILPAFRLYAAFSHPGTWSMAEVDALTQQASAMIAEISLWAQAYRRIQAERSALNFNTMISEPLMTAFDIAGLTDVVASQLPQMGIRSCYLSLYDTVPVGKPVKPTKWSRLILAYNEQKRYELEPGGKRFLTDQLVPEDILSGNKRFAVMLEPLHFRDEIQLGFVIFEPLHTQEGELRDALSRQISTALKGALLLQERKRSERALKKSERNYRSLLEFNHEILRNAAIGIIRLDEDMKIQYENPELERIIGLPPEAASSRAMGMDIRKLPGIQEAGLVPYLNDLQKGKVVVLETSFHSIYGKETIVRITGSPIREDEQVSGSVLLVEDVTKRKKAEEALHESEKMYQVVIETTDTGYVVLDEACRVVDANLNYVHLTGLSIVDEIRGRLVTDWTAPYDLNRHREALRKCLEDGCVQNLEIDYLHPDGLTTPVEVNANTVQTKDGTRIVKLCRDITERKQTRDALASSEQRYRILAEASHDMIYIIGELGNVEYVNDFASRQLDLPPEAVIGKPMQDLFVAEVARRQFQSIQQVISSGEPEYIEAPSGFPGGERWLGSWLVPLKDGLGSTSVMGVSRDITERILADRALKQYSERLEEMVGERTVELQEALHKAQLADSLKSEFIANINHELRTPLTNLILYHQMLRAGPEIKTQERLDVIGREIQRLRILIEDMLKLSHLETGQMLFRPLPQNLNRIIQTLVNDRSNIAEEHGLKLALELQTDLPSVWLDETMTVQVISNLMTNAMNYTPAGGKVHISTRSLQDRSGNPGVAFTVKDTGPGVSQEDLPHLFERFYRGKAGHSAGIPGTGLGLAIVKQMVEKHHGWIEVDNIAGSAGAVFTVWLPLEQKMEFSEKNP